MKLIVIHREPIVDRVPNLKSLISYAAEKIGHVTLLTTKNDRFPEARFENQSIEEILIKERTRKVELATSIKLFFHFILLSLKSSLEREKVVFIFAGRGALVIAGFLRYLGLSNYVSFVVEYPDIELFFKNEHGFFDRLELHGILGAKFFITHDEIHGETINSVLVGQSSEYMVLPNSTRDQIASGNSCFLHKRLDLPAMNKILLHSGGFGEVFSSRELAQASSYLPDGFVLVFHFSHDVCNDKYFNDYIKGRNDNDKSILSLKPVSTSELDALISSAYIGFAWYNVEKLSFRAKKMGLAAGKIGNYLKCGIPVIAPFFDSLSYIDDHKCGVLINDFSEISDAIKLIDLDYQKYSVNAKICYQQLWEPEPYLKKISQRLTSF